MQQAILQVTITHELVDEAHTASFSRRREAEKLHNSVRVNQLLGEENLVLEFALALQRSGVHDLDGDREVTVRVLAVRG